MLSGRTTGLLEWLPRLVGVPTASPASDGPVVGFDLDMTLIDSRPGIKAAFNVLADETGVAIDTDLVVSRLGPPVEVEMSHWFGSDRAAAMADRYRELYPTYAIAPSPPLPGVADALAAVHALSLIHI